MKKILLLFDHPKFEDVKKKAVGIAGPTAVYLKSLEKFNVDINEIKTAFVVNKTFKKSNKLKSTEALKYHDQVWENIRKFDVETIILAGDIPIKAVLGKSWNVKKLSGDFVELKQYPGYRFYATVSDTQLMYNPDNEDRFVRDAINICDHQRDNYELKPRPKIVEIRTLENLELLLQIPNKKISLDCEWHGITWADPRRYTRTVQLGLSSDLVITVVLNSCGGKEVIDNSKAYKILKEFFRDKEIIGQNAIADGLWLYSFGIDIRNNVVYDTMLAEHLIDSLGPFNLESLVTKYTRSGRYDIELEQWKQSVKSSLYEPQGYGNVPDEILIPYGAYDVSTLWDIMEAQIPELEPYHKSVNGYPTLWEVELSLQKVLWEVELTGLNVDVKRLATLITIYQKKLNELKTEIVDEVKVLDEDLEDFNPDSPQQIQKLLFNVLGLTPVMTTSKQKWSDVAGNVGMDDDEEINPSTDSTTLTFLQDEHPIVKKLLLYKRIAKACQNWLPIPKPGANIKTRGGGIPGKIWPDGKLHPRFSQLIKTGRLSSTNPNVQNWGKKAEAPLRKAFEVPPPTIRSIIVAPEEHVLIEADFKQAELFVLANLSKDKNMLKALYTPGLDMHDFTTTTAFKLDMMLGENSITHDDLSKIASISEDYYEEVLKNILYISEDQCLSRSEFKDTLRIAGKAVSFKIMYGSGPEGIATGIKKESNLSDSIDKLTEDIKKVMNTWKYELYPDAWSYLENCANCVTEQGYVENVWGRRRIFSPTDNDKLIASFKREAQNNPIQGAVGGATSIAMILMCDERKKRGLNFRICNQIHDAVQVYAPKSETKETIKLLKDTMGNIRIPLDNGKNLILDIDIDIMTRWGEKE